MLVDVEVYIPKRRLPGFLLRWFFTPTLVRSTAPHFPRIGEKIVEKRIPVAVSCPECASLVEVR